MNRSLHWNRTTLSLATAVILVVAGLTGGTLYAHRYQLLAPAAGRLDQWGREELRSRPAAAAWLLRAAVWAAPANHTYARNLAAAYLANDQPGAALAALGITATGPLGNPALARAAAVVELGQASTVTATEATLTQAHGVDEQVVAVDLALISGTLVPLPATVTAPEAIKRIQTAQASVTALAADLASLGLLDSASALLANAAQPTTDSWRLLATIRSQCQDWGGARQALHAGIALKPSDIGLRRQLIEVDRRLGNTAEVNQQQQLLDQLTGGKV